MENPNLGGHFGVIYRADAISSSSPGYLSSGVCSGTHGWAREYKLKKYVTSEPRVEFHRRAYDGPAALDKDLPHQVGAVINTGEAKAADELSDSSSRWSLPGSKTERGSGGGLKERLRILTIGQVWESKADVAICAHRADEAGYYDSQMNMDVCFLG